MILLTASAYTQMEWTAGIVGILVGVVAIGHYVLKFWKFTFAMARRVGAILDLADHELQHNSGSSTKDAAVNAARDSAQALEIVKELKGNIDDLTVNSLEEDREIWRYMRKLKKEIDGKADSDG